MSSKSRSFQVRWRSTPKMQRIPRRFLRRFGFEPTWLILGSPDRIGPKLRKALRKMRWRRSETLKRKAVSSSMWPKQVGQRTGEKMVA